MVEETFQIYVVLITRKCICKSILPTKRQPFQMARYHLRYHFVHCISCHISTKCFPFVMVFNYGPVLPIDIKHNLLSNLDIDDHPL